MMILMLRDKYDMALKHRFLFINNADKLEQFKQTTSSQIKSK